MINGNRIADELMELFRIDSVSFKEREMADRLKEKFAALGLDVWEDDAAGIIGGNAGNLIATRRGNPNGIPLLIAAHMDTVEPGTGKKPVFRDGVFYSDGSTVLGADNAAAVEIILEAARVIIEENIPCGDLTFVITAAEESGLNGAACLDIGKIHARYGIVLDCPGKPGTIALKACGRYGINAVITGRAAHAGIEPEKGISALQIAARAITAMRLGRIDAETTANIGMIHGGYASNIICEKVSLRGEVRSFRDGRMLQETELIRNCLEESAACYGGHVFFDSKKEYPALSLKENDPVIALLKAGAFKTGLSLEFVSTGGGSDANIFNARGIPTANIGIGMENMHSTRECIKLESIIRSTQWLLAVIQHT